MTRNHPEPLDEAALLNPTPGDALATAGAIIHWVASDPELVDRFAAWIEHCPGDLSQDLVYRVLAVTHDVLQPFCPDPIKVRPA